MLRRAALLALPALSAAPARAEPRRYVFDQAAGRIGFTARHIGWLRSQGWFGRFRATLWLDPARANEARVDCEVETASATIPFPGAEELLRSEPFFDAARHPTARFAGMASGTGSSERFAIAGELTLRGVTRPLAMEARLLGRGRDAEGEFARFEAGGELSRSAFGMVAERTLIGDLIGLNVAVTVRL